MNTAFPENHSGAPRDFAFLATHAPFIPPTPQRLNPWLATLASRRIDYVIQTTPAGAVIWVPLHLNQLAQAELTQYEKDNANWPRHRDTRQVQHPPLFSDFAICTFILVEAALFRFFLFVHAQPARLDDWHSRGVWNMDAILNAREWWRCITALTLHADAHHVLSNALWGFIFGALAASRIGTGVTMLLMLLTGALANATMVLCSEGDHQSLGASTMVFALLGMLTAIHTIHLFKHREDGRGIIRLIPWVPLAFGIAMGALSGAAPGSDVLAHALGFIWGLILGMLPQACPNLTRGPAEQFLAGTLALASLALAWLAAFYHQTQ